MCVCVCFSTIHFKRASVLTCVCVSVRYTHLFHVHARCGCAPLCHTTYTQHCVSQTERLTNSIRCNCLMLHMHTIQLLQYVLFLSHSSFGMCGTKCAHNICAMYARTTRAAPDTGQLRHALFIQMLMVYNLQSICTYVYSVMLLPYYVWTFLSASGTCQVKLTNLRIRFVLYYRAIIKSIDRYRVHQMHSSFSCTVFWA